MKLDFYFTDHSFNCIYGEFEGSVVGSIIFLVSLKVIGLICNMDPTNFADLIFICISANKIIVYMSNLKEIKESFLSRYSLWLMELPCFLSKFGGNACLPKDFVFLNDLCFQTMNNIIKSIRKYYPVSDKALKSLTDNFMFHKFPKRHLIICEGIIDRNIYFIEKGICRSFVHHEGKEVTTWFSKEGDITFALEALYHGKEGFENVQTIEACEIYSISIPMLNNLYAKEIDIANWSRVIHQECLLAVQCTRIDRLNLSAKERYEKLLEENPDLCNRVNLGYIASYLGITLPSLSKIRTEYSSIF